MLKTLKKYVKKICKYKKCLYLCNVKQEQTLNTTDMKTYILQKNQQGRDKWLYTIVDNENNIVAKRTSKRDYVAATIDGQFFFGRRDLVGYGDHGKALIWARKQMHATTGTYLEEIHSSRKWAAKNGYNPDEYVARLKERMGSPEEWVEKMHAAGRDLLDRMQVAYLPE